MSGLNRAVLIVSMIPSCWLGMQAVHELGHVLGAGASGGNVERVVLHPLAISRTDVSPNPHPLCVVWAGPVFGTLMPLAVWGLAAAARMPGAFLLRFFAGFSCVANGAYIGMGSIWEVGDSGDMLRHGSSPWQLWLFGATAVPLGLILWHRQGRYFGMGADRERVSPRVAAVSVAMCVTLLVVGFIIGGR